MGRDKHYYLSLIHQTVLDARNKCNYNVITMKSKVIKIGNSKGIRLPKTMIDEAGLDEEVILEASQGGIVIRPSKKIRGGWEAAFRDMALQNDDKLLDSEIITSSWDAKEWEWK